MCSLLLFVVFGRSLNCLRSVFSGVGQYLHMWSVSCVFVVLCLSVFLSFMCVWCCVVCYVCVSVLELFV